MSALITEILAIEPYKLTLQFNNGEVRVVDLEPVILKMGDTDDSIYAPLKNPEFFNSVQLQPEWQTIYWSNGLDFCPDVLYSMSTQTES